MTIFYKELLEQKWYQEGLLIVLEEFCNEYLQVSHQGYSALKPQRSSRLQVKDAQ
jgi:hypothetical protein